MSIYAITGKPRNGKTYYVVSRIPTWLDEYVREQNIADVDSSDRPALDDSFPVGCIYSNIKLNLGIGKLKEYPERIVGDLHNEMDLRNPTKLVFYWTHIQDWNLMTRRGRILCDEAQRYFNARQWAQLNPETEIKLQQHGKEDLDVWAMVQHISRVDIVFRQLCELIGDVRMTFGNPDNRGGYLGFIPKRSEIVWMFPEHLDPMGRLLPTVPLEERLPTENFWIWKKVGAMYDTRQKVGRTGTMPLVHRELYCEDPNCLVHGLHAGKPKIVHLGG